jgi:hypothetical protein
MNTVDCVETLVKWLLFTVISRRSDLDRGY